MAEGQKLDLFLLDQLGWITFFSFTSHYASLDDAVLPFQLLLVSQYVLFRPAVLTLTQYVDEKQIGHLLIPFICHQFTKCMTPCFCPIYSINRTSTHVFAQELNVYVVLLISEGHYCGQIVVDVTPSAKKYKSV